MIVAVLLTSIVLLVVVGLSLAVWTFNRLGGEGAGFFAGLGVIFGTMLVFVELLFLLKETVP